MTANNATFIVSVVDGMEDPNAGGRNTEATDEY